MLDSDQKLVIQQYPREICIITQLCFSKLQTMLLTSFEDSFFLDLIVEVWSKIHNAQSKVNDEYELCLINVIVLSDILNKDAVTKRNIKKWIDKNYIMLISLLIWIGTSNLINSNNINFSLPYHISYIYQLN